MDESGHLQCSYLGTDPSVFTRPSTELRDLDYSRTDDEMAQLQAIIKEKQTKSSNFKSFFDSNEQKLNWTKRRLNKMASGAQCFIMALSLFWDIVTGLPWTPNGVGSLEPRGYCFFLPGAHYLTINSPDGADSLLNKLLLLLLDSNELFTSLTSLIPYIASILNQTYYTQNQVELKIFIVAKPEFQRHYRKFYSLFSNETSIFWIL